MKLKYIFLSFLFIQAIIVGACKKNDTVPPDLILPETASLNEGNSIQSILTVPISLSSPSDKQVNVKLSTSDGTAKAGQDYAAFTDTILVFQPGETSKNFDVKVISDKVFETDETFYISASHAINANLIKYRTIVTITNDDVFAPVVNVGSETKAIEGNTIPLTAKVNVVLSGVYDKEISLKWSTHDATAKSGIDYVAVSGASLVFAPGETQKFIEVQLINDQIFEFDDSLSVTVDEVTNATLGNNHSKVIITNDDVYTPEIAADGTITPDNYPEMSLVWSDEFNGASISSDNWTFETGGGGWGNNELETYTNAPNNAFVEGGKLNIVATKLYSIYNSARMITKGKKEFTYGRIDIRAKLPYGQGIWPALWMLGKNISQVGWPKCGEIDIMEYLGHEVSRVYGTAHYDDNGHQYKGGNYSLPSGNGFNDKFHVFTILWQENSIIWYVDYQKYYEVTPATVVFDSFRLPQFFIFNVAVGGNWPGNPNASTVFPQTMQVDYVRVFQPS